jgi:protein transport protein SEC24
MPPGGPAPVHGRPPPPGTTYQQESRPKIDPSQIPRPPLFTRPQETGEPTPVYFPKSAVTQAGDARMLPPPPADSRYTVRDDGNASPDLIRSSVYAFPTTRGTWHHTGDVPLGVLCTPLAVSSEDFTPRPRMLPDRMSEAWKDPQYVPLVLGSDAPARCGTCSAYINPFFGTDGTCNLCKGRNWRLQSALSGLPMQYGTVDYEVDGPYITRQRPVEPVQVYAIDLTCPDLHLYLPILAQLGQDMANHFWRQPDSQLIPRMGVCFASSAGIIVRGHDDIHGRYSVMSDITEDPFCPMPLNDWTYDLSTVEGLVAWQKFVNEDIVSDLEHLKNEFKGKNAYGRDGLDVSCGGAALAFLADALAKTGGRGTLITWRRPNFGVGRLPYREELNANSVDAPEDSTCYTPLQLQTNFKCKEDEVAATFYSTLGKDCAKDRVSLDILMHNSPVVPPPFLDLATMGELCRVTCGKLMWVTTSDWDERLYEELSRQLQTFSGWDAVFKVRCSEGLQVKSFMSNNGTVMDGQIGSLELELPVVTPSTCISVELEHRVGGIPNKAPFIYIQTALLYSTLTGKRRMRVSTLALRASSVVNDVYRSIDFAAFTTLLLREAALRLRSPISEEEKRAVRTKSREMLYNRCILILACYRQHTPAKESPKGQLILPDKLQLLPLFCMCLMKSPMLRAPTPRLLHGVTKMSPTSDERANHIIHLTQAGPGISMLMVHANIFPIINIVEGVGKWNSSGIEGYLGYIKMPQPILPSMENLEDNGVYLIDSGLTIYLYIGKLASNAVKEQLLGDDADSSDLMSLVNRLVWQMRSYTSKGRGRESELRPNVPPLVTVREQEGHSSSLEQNVLNLMIDDGMAGERDFVEFLCTLHRRIRERVDAKA